MVPHLLRRYFSKEARSKLKCLDILENDLGRSASRRRNECCDKNGLPLPWYTYPALEYLEQINWSGASVFEYGSGNSTLFWAKRCAHVTAVEHDKSWHRQVQHRVNGSNSSVHLATNGRDYVDFIRKQSSALDLVVIDGEYRAACAEQSVTMLKPGGAVLLDNSDWHPEAAEILRAADLIEVDFTGFGPLNDYTWTTTLFMKRDFRPKFLSSRHPIPGRGGLDNRATIHVPFENAA